MRPEEELLPPGEASCLEPFDELVPAVPGLARGQMQPQELALPIGSHADAEHNGRPVSRSRWHACQKPIAECFATSRFSASITASSCLGFGRYLYVLRARLTVQQP